MLIRAESRRTALALLESFPILGLSDKIAETEWRLERDDGAIHTLQHELCLVCGDSAAVCDAAADGIGIGFLPDHACARHIETGRLVHMLRDWKSPPGIIHLVFTIRRGLPPAVRTLIDRLSRDFSRL